jgi:hypothetical protein
MCSRTNDYRSFGCRVLPLRPGQAVLNRLPGSKLALTGGIGPKICASCQQRHFAVPRRLTWRSGPLVSSELVGGQIRAAAFQAPCLSVSESTSIQPLST